MKKGEEYLVIIRRFGFYILAVVVVIGVLGGLFSLIPRQWQEIRQLQSDKQEISDKVVGLTKGLAVISGIDPKMLARNLVAVNAALPSQKKTSGLFTGISQIAQSSGVTFKQLEFSPGVVSTDSADIPDEVLAGGKVRRVKASLGISGDMASLITFLKQIQSSNQLVGVEQLSYSGSTAREQAAQIGLQVYFQPASEGEIDWGAVRPTTPEEDITLKALSTRDVFLLPEELR